MMGKFPKKLKYANLTWIFFSNVLAITHMTFENFKIIQCVSKVLSDEFEKIWDTKITYLEVA